MNERLKKEISLLPNNPGCYLMHDSDDKIIYIGKAKNLKNRVSQYFNRPHEGKTAAMVSHVDHFEIILTKTEKEAFILEMNLIQKHLPRYNIMLKDDKHYPYIAIHKVKDPYVSIARNMKDKKCEYYGPFPISSNAYQMIDIINKYYPLRKCKNVQKEPCLYYHMNQCVAPCINKISKEKYEEIISEIRKMLRGDNSNIIKKIKEEIKVSSEKLDFENAALNKKILDSINDINEHQEVELLNKANVDIFAYFVKEGYVSIALLIIRKGVLIAKRNFVYEIIDELEEFLTNIICQYYEYNQLPNEIVIGNELVCENVSNLLDIKASNPSKGKFHDLISTAQINAKEGMDEHFLTARLDDNKIQLLETLGDLLKIKTPYRIELFDNSHLQGSDAIGAMVCFVNGEPVKKMYRKFNIESFNKKDDISSMKEVLTRRYSRLKEENNEMPDLVILDGGIEQVNIAKKTLEEIGVIINVAGLQKDSNHRTNCLLDSNGNSIDLGDYKSLFFLLTRMQDEVHRFAITSHIHKRSKSMYKSIFDDIDGLGPKRIEIILKTYPTLEDLKKTSIDELSQIIPKEVAENLLESIKKHY